MPNANALPGFHFPFLDRSCRIGAWLMLAFFFVIAATATQAATIVVTTTSDELNATSTDGAGVSLREAIRDANATPADDTILLAAGIYTLTIVGADENNNATGDLDIDGGGKLTLVGSGAGATIDATGLGERILHAHAGADVALRGLTLTGGNDGFGGAVLNANGSNLAISDCTFHGNSSPAGTNTGVLELGGTVTIERCTFHDNTSGRDGGVVSVVGDVDIIQSTFTNNTATGNGGAIFVFSGTLDLIHCTVTGNTASGGDGGGGVWNLGGTLNLENTIVAGNTASPGANIAGAVNSSGQNLTSGDPQLGALADNGGSTQTMAPNPGSPAIDPAGGDTTSPLATDQRGAARVSGGIVDIGAVEHDTFQQLLDGGDAIEVANNADSGPGSLRQALADAAVGSALGTRITFANSLDDATITLGGTQLEVAAGAPPVDIDASGLANGVIISGNNASRVLQIGSGSQARLENLTITGGHAPDGADNLGGNGDAGENGGGILNNGSLQLTRCTVSNNQTGDGGDGDPGSGTSGGSGTGGGISNGGTLRLTECTISDNRTGDAGDAFGVRGLGGGGGIFGESGSRTIATACLISGNIQGGPQGDLGGGGLRNIGNMTLTACTVTGNECRGGGGGIRNDPGGTLKVSGCTVTDNQDNAGNGGIRNLADLTLTNSIVAGNSGGNLINLGGSVIETGVNLTSGDPQLAPLGDFGGPTRTMPPLPGSPALDTADDNLAEATDQRGVARPQGSQSDIGAVELDKALMIRLIVENGGSVFTVTKTSDSGAGSLRQAVADANAVITGPGAVILITSKVKKPIALTGGQLLVDNSNVPVVILGAEIPSGGTFPVETAARPTISGSNLSRVFEIANGTDALLCNLAIRDGNADLTFGGGISNDGVLTLSDCDVSGNQTDKSGGGIYSPGDLTLTSSTVTGNRTTTNGVGGGIYSAGGDLIMTNSTVSDNQTGENEGGGIYNFGVLTLTNSTVSNNRTGENGHGGGMLNFGTLTLTNSTVSGNRAGPGGDGGGIHSFSGSVSLINSTVSGNQTTDSGEGGGIEMSGGTLSLTNSIVAGNTSPTDPDIFGTINTENGINITNGDPQLAALDNYGGPTETMPPLPGSPALDFADPAFAPATDQRGTARKQGFGFDIGAVEADAALLTLLTERGTAPGTPSTPPTETGSDDLAAAAGNFSGLITDADGNIAGKLDFRLKADGTFSASGNFSPLGARISVRGTLDGSGTATFFGFAKAGRDEFPFELRLVMTANGFRLDGRLADGDSEFIFDSDRAAFDRKNPSPFAGKFTALIPADPSADAPQGDGYLVLTSGVDGKIRALGALGDNTRLTLKTSVSADGIFPLFAEVYRTNPERGRIGGTVTFRDVPGISDFDGELFWKKLPNTRDRLFPEGFEAMPTVIGSVYREQPSGTPVLPSIIPGNADNATWLAGRGNVTLPGEKMLSWDGRNRVTPTLESDERLRISTTARSGLVRGDYSHRGNGTKIRFSGVAFQKQELIAGVFPGNGETGFFSILPAGLPELVFPSTFDMGQVGFEGGISEAVVFLRNTGAGNLYLPHAPVIEDPNSPFSVIGGGPVLIPPGQGTFIRLRFDPNDNFNGFADVLKIVSNDPTTPVFDCLLTGSGVAGSADGIIPLDRWEGESPTDRVLPFGTTLTNRFTAADFGEKYEGYVREDNAREDLVGLMTLNLSARNGGFSAVATINGVRHSLRGAFAEGNAVTNGTTNRGAAFQLEFHEANTGGNSFKIIGTIDDKKVELVRGSATNGSEPFKDRFSIILPSSDARAVGQPLGDGFGSLTVDHLGRIRGSFVLGDGTKVSHAGLRSVDSEWLFYKDIYRTKPKGFLGGRVVFREVVGISDFDGRFQWVKHADNREKRYPRGFELSQEVLGSRYFVPATGNRAFPGLTSGPDNLDVTFTGLDIPALPGTTEWFDSNKIVYTPVGNERVSMRVNPKTGLISGVYSDGPNKIRLPFGAVIFGRQDIGVGTVLGATETGPVTLTPAE